MRPLDRYLIRYHLGMTAGEILATARRRSGLSLRELAARAGTSHSTIAAYEQGRKVPRVDTLARICRAAGQALDWGFETRPGGAEREQRRQSLLDVLALADAFPFARTGPLDAPVFPRPSR